MTSVSNASFAFSDFLLQPREPEEILLRNYNRCGIRRAVLLRPRHSPKNTKFAFSKIRRCAVAPATVVYIRVANLINQRINFPWVRESITHFRRAILSRTFPPVYATGLIVICVRTEDLFAGRELNWIKCACSLHLFTTLTSKFGELFSELRIPWTHEREAGSTWTSLLCRPDIVKNWIQRYSRGVNFLNWKSIALLNRARCDRVYMHRHRNF